MEAVFRLPKNSGLLAIRNLVSHFFRPDEQGDSA
jgi:hypothetical protein